MKIDKNSRGTIALVYLFCIAVSAVLIAFVDIPWLVWGVIAGFVWVCVWQLFFFRVPSRETSADGSKVCSVADGRVVILQKAVEREFLQRECIQLSVYMNFFDVHANFWPVDGEVVYYKYYPGKHSLAFKPKVSLDNEHTCVCIRTASGKEVFFKQIAGGFARRIVCYAQNQKHCRAGQQCGVIKFGSRIDMYLPLDADIKVKLGDYVRACETILAEI